MIKKIVLLLLLVVLCALSVALYNQYRQLPRHTLTDARDLAGWTDRMDRANRAAPAVSERSPLPPPEETAPRQQPRMPLSESVPDATAEQTLEPSQETSPKAPPPLPLVADRGANKDPMLDPTSLGHPELSLESRPAPAEAPHPVEARPELESKAEKILDRTEHWVEEKVEKVEDIVGKVKKELRTEEKIITDMEISREDAALPETRVDKLVRQIEEKALGEIKPEPAIREPIVKPSHVYELEPEPKDDSKQPTLRNRVVSIELTLESNETILDIRTEAPIAQHKVFQIKDPRRLVVDLYGSFRGSRPRLEVPKNSLINDVRTGLHPDKLRIVADLHPEAAISVAEEPRSPTRLVVILKPGN